jgi:PAS domain S-box-containing protein
VLIDRNYRVAWINPAACGIFSVTREAVVGRDKRELSQLLAPGMVEGGAEVAARWLRRFTGEEQGPLECHVLAGDGRSGRWIELTLERIPLGPLAGGWVEFVRDTTDRKRGEAYAEELRLALEEQRLILENMAGFTYRHDRNGVFHYVSRSVERITGYSVEEWMRHYTAYLTDNPINARVVEHTEETLRSGRISPPYKVEIYHENRSRIMLEVSEQPYFEGGRVAGIVGIALDITDRQRLENRLQHIEKAQSLGLLAEGIAHDFNNLLTVVLGNAALALEELPPEQPAHEALQEIVRTTRRAADLCQQMLAYSGKGTRRFEPVDLSDVAAETGRMLEVSIPKQVRVVYELGRELPQALGDPVQIRQVALNLVTNASEAIGDRPGELRLRTGAAAFTRAELKAGLSAPEPIPGTYVWLEVEDDGPGMDEATQARIFDPFFTTKVSGRGLGLSTVLGIMRGHEGAIRIWSEPGKGTRFRVLFPAAPAPAAGPAGPEEEPAASLDPRAPIAGGRVLLIDDDPAVLKVGRRMLEKLGYEVLTAAGGREGLELFRERRAEILFCVIDLTMPEMSGEEAFRALRVLAPEVRVLLTSGFDKSEALKRLGRGMRFEFLQKPFEQAALAAAIQNLLAGPRNARRG